jgi:hypothetical protein
MLDSPSLILLLELLGSHCQIPRYTKIESFRARITAEAMSSFYIPSFDSFLIPRASRVLVRPLAMNKIKAPWTWSFLLIQVSNDILQSFRRKLCSIRERSQNVHVWSGARSCVIPGWRLPVNGIAMSDRWFQSLSSKLLN